MNIERVAVKRFLLYSSTIPPLLKLSPSSTVIRKVSKDFVSQLKNELGNAPSPSSKSLSTWFRSSTPSRSKSILFKGALISGSFSLWLKSPKKELKTILSIMHIKEKILSRACVGKGARGAWHPQNFKTSHLAAANFKVICTTGPRGGLFLGSDQMSPAVSNF